MYPLHDKDLDRLSRDASEHYEMDFGSSGWEQLEKRLDQELPQDKGKRRRFLFWLFFIVVTTGSALTGLLINSQPLTPLAGNIRAAAPGHKDANAMDNSGTDQRLPETKTGEAKSGTGGFEKNIELSNKSNDLDDRNTELPEKRPALPGRNSGLPEDSKRLADAVPKSGSGTTIPKTGSGLAIPQTGNSTTMPMKGNSATDPKSSTVGSSTVGSGSSKAGSSTVGNSTVGNSTVGSNKDGSNTVRLNKANVTPPAATPGRSAANKNTPSLALSDNKRLQTTTNAYKRQQTFTNGNKRLKPVSDKAKSRNNFIDNSNNTTSNINSSTGNITTSNINSSSHDKSNSLTTKDALSQKTIPKPVATITPNEALSPKTTPTAGATLLPGATQTPGATLIPNTTLDSTATIAKSAKPKALPDTANTHISDPENAGPDPAKSISRKPKKQGPSQPHGFEFGLTAGPDKTIVEFGPTDKTGYNFGAQIGYRFSNRWSVNTGVILTKRFYKATGDKFKPETSYGEVRDVKGYCEMLDIPLNVRYDLSYSDRRRFFASIGMSSYLMYDQLYEIVGRRYPTDPWNPPYARPYHNQQNHFFSVTNFSLGYERKVTNHFSIQAEPYLKIPLTGLGYGYMKMDSYGMFFTLKYRP